ncbi:hypothetical protein I3843_03G070100 [Carya illinoinensis]|nr:hypothetical protein I3843_03G070100 [Carya illinoinensis]
MTESKQENKQEKSNTINLRGSTLMVYVHGRNGLRSLLISNVLHREASETLKDLQISHLTVRITQISFTTVKTLVSLFALSLEEAFTQSAETCKMKIRFSERPIAIHIYGGTDGTTCTDPAAED